mgnify:CR=1 FL=1
MSSQKEAYITGVGQSEVGVRLTRSALGLIDERYRAVSLARDTLNKIILQETNLVGAISFGEVKVSGNQAKLNELVSDLDTFEFWFNIVTP